MHTTSFFTGFILATSLLCNAVSTVYRSDKRAPADVKKAGGFVCKGGNKPEGTLFEHVEGTLKHPSKDPFVSTTDDLDVAKGKGGYVYTIDTSKVHDHIWDVAAEYEKAKRKYGHAKEKEFAVEGTIPWAAVTHIIKKNKGKWEDVPIPTKRSSRIEAGSLNRRDDDMEETDEN